jgi:hypothetical protein
MILSTEQLLADWYKRIRFVQYCHYEAAKACDRLNLWLGIPVIVLSTWVGSSVFASLGQDSVNSTLQILTGLISLLAATLASLQTFFRFTEKAEKHRLSAARYGALRRETEEMLATCSQPPAEMIATLRQKLDRLADEAPHIPHRSWARRQQVLREDGHHQVGLADRSS